MSNLPKGWSLVELNEICNINMGQSPKSESYNENNIGLPLIQGNADIKNRKTLPRTYTSDITKKCKIGDIIMTVRAPVGAIAKSYHNACIGRGVCSITPKENNDFLYHFLVGYEDKWDKLSQGSTFTAVNGNDIKKIKLPLPPLEEQKKIADILSTVDKKIAFVEENINATEELKKGLMQKLLTEGIGHTEFKDSELGRIPEGWKVVKLEEVCTKIVGGGTPSKNEPDYWNNGTIPWVTPSEFTKSKSNYISVTESKISEEGLKNSSATLLAIGTVIMSSRATIGECKINTIEITTNQGFISFQCNDLLNNLYLLYFIKQNKPNILKISSGSTFLEVSRTSMKNFSIAIPPLEEQKQIAEILSTVDKKLENLKEKKQSFEELKKGLMQKLLTGEVRL
ncbi:restriction endonuclease subunit S [Aliarcobacter butzleri]|uniref:restriction endonuclease subunit S n=1 Tax=Aliarcobacter butzleri TaxID=28197 RepID=UPI00125EF459|nr:restriction endonuclease subunit S [Aliarcobacter butzleri]